MPAPATNEELFALIAKSGVVENAKVKAYLEKLTSGEGVPTDPIKLGGLMVRDGVLTHFQAEQLLQGRWKRFNIGKYRVLERLGVGGMGQVFLCEHKLMKRKVAVKVLPAAKAKDEAALQRFYREARAVAAVDHPNIVRAYDIDDDDDLHFLVMEYVDGANLHDIVRKSGPLPPIRACHYVFGAAVGLQHAHEIGLVHRDIKPANILVDRTGVVKVLDMGLARFFNPEDDDNLTKKFDENVLGTADYLSPEQAMDSTGVDIRADIYGLGGTFYFMLTGQPPFPDGTVAQKLLWHQSKQPRPISDYRSDIPPQLIEIVNRMLAKAPDDRFATPAEVTAALAPWVQSPIAPPSDEELPNLSVAAGGKSASKSNAPTVVGPSHGTSTVPPGQPVAVAHKVAVALIPAPAQLPVAAPRPVDPPANPWVGLQQGETASLSQDTSRNRRERDKKRSPEPTSRRSGDRRGDRDETSPKEKSSAFPWVILVGVGGLLVLGGAVTTLVYIFLGQPGSGTSSTTDLVQGPKVWYVSKSGNGPNPATTKSSLADAFRELKSGDEVVILDESIETGPVAISGVRDIRISAAGGGATLVYQSAESRNVTAVIHVRGSENITLSGLTIEVGGKHDIGIQVSGRSNGVSINDVTVLNAKQHALNLLNVTATDDQPLVVQRCRLLLRKGAQSGVNLSGSSTLDTRSVRISGCRIEGNSGGVGVRVEGATEDVVLRNNRLFQLDTGVLFVPDATPPTVCKVTIERNTFHTTKVGVKVDQPSGKNRSLLINRNYFTSGVAVTTANPTGVTFSDNGRDAQTTAGVSAAIEVVGVTLPVPPKDATDDEFLRSRVPLQVNGNAIGAE